MTQTETKTHPSELELAGFLDGSLPKEDKARIEGHISNCNECLIRVVSAYESVESFKKKSGIKKGALNNMKKINLYLVLAVLSFLFSFTMPKYFIQLLVATLLLGIKWIVDSKSTKMLVMIYEAWKKGGEKEIGEILETLKDRINIRK